MKCLPRKMSVQYLRYLLIGGLCFGIYFLHSFLIPGRLVPISVSTKYKLVKRQGWQFKTFGKASLTGWIRDVALNFGKGGGVMCNNSQMYYRALRQRRWLSYVRESFKTGTIYYWSALLLLFSLPYFPTLKAKNYYYVFLKTVFLVKKNSLWGWVF